VLPTVIGIDILAKKGAPLDTQKGYREYPGAKNSLNTTKNAHVTLWEMCYMDKSFLRLRRLNIYLDQKAGFVSVQRGVKVRQRKGATPGGKYMAMTEPIRDKHQVRALTEYYRKRGQLRNHCLIVLGVHTALRVSDLLRLRREDVYDFKLERARACIAIAEKKTGKMKLIALNKCAIRALSAYI
jgi:integrase